MTGWSEICELLATEHGGLLVVPHGRSRRRWTVPTEDSGSFTVEIVLGPRWATITVDRHHTSPRDESGIQWIKRNVGIVSGATVRQSNSGPGILIIRANYATAYPIPRERLLEVLDLWVGRERAWAGVEATI